MSKRSMVALVLMLVILPSVAFGAGLVQIVPQECNQDGGCPSICNLGQLAQNILNDGIYIAVFLSAILFAWAGWKYLTHVANPGEIQRAQEIFFNVVVGLVIIVAAWLIVDTLMKTLTGGKFGPWNKICQVLQVDAAPFA